MKIHVLIAILCPGIAWAEKPTAETPQLEMGVSATQKPEVEYVKFERKDIFDALEKGEKYLNSQKPEKGGFIQKAEYDSNSHCWKILVISADRKEKDHLLSVFDSGVVMWSRVNTNAG